MRLKRLLRNGWRSIRHHSKSATPDHRIPAHEGNHELSEARCSTEPISSSLVAANMTGLCQESADAVQHEPKVISANIHHPLINLPPEMVLGIMKFLSQESQILLSLTCKALYKSITPLTDSSTSDACLRTRFLRLLEIDHPEYLTCKICGWMYIWRRRVRFRYSCPRSSRHPRKTDRALRHTAVCIEHWLFMSPQIHELLLRANARGLSHGIPITLLNTNCVAEDQVFCKTLGRFVDGQLLLASIWSLDLDLTENLRRGLFSLNQAMCLHRYAVKPRFDDEIISKILNRDQSPEMVTAKCGYCATDYSASSVSHGNGRVRILLEVWQNFGDGCTTSLDTRQMFHTERFPTELPTDSPSAPALRDIKRLFKSQEGEPLFDPECGHDQFDDWNDADKAASILEAVRELQY